MGFKVKIEGAETIDLSIESVQTVNLLQILQKIQMQDQKT